MRAKKFTDTETQLDRLNDTADTIRGSSGASALFRADSTFETDMYQPSQKHLKFLLRVINTRAESFTNEQRAASLSMDRIANGLLSRSCWLTPI